MTRKEIERILSYCTKASDGPWGRNPSKPKVVASRKDQPRELRSDICQLVGETHDEDWRNYHFIINARKDLPALAETYLRLLDTLELTNNQLEQERGRKRWLQLKRAKRRLELEKEKQQTRRLQKTIEYLKKRQENLGQDLERERLNSKTEVSKARQRLEYEKEQYKKQIDDAWEQLRVEREKWQQELDTAKEQLRIERVNREIQIEKLNEQMNMDKAESYAQLERANRQLEIFKRCAEDDIGYCDGLLTELDRVEAVLNNRYMQAQESGHRFFMSASTAISKPQESQASDSEPVQMPTNDDLLRELKKIEASLPKYKKKSTDKQAPPAAAANKTAAVASEFVDTPKAQKTESEETVKH